MKVGIHEIPDMIKDDEMYQHYFAIESIQGSYIAGYAWNKYGIRHWLFEPNESNSIDGCIVNLVDQFEILKKSLHVDDGCTFWVWSHNEKTYKEMK